jgi:hypothetical protein
MSMKTTNTAAKKGTEIRPPRHPPRALTVRQQRFAEFVAAGMPAIKAYSKAGYSQDRKIAEAHASRLVENGGVAALIAKLREPQTKAAKFTKEEKLAYLAAICRTSIGEIGPDSPLCQEFTEERIGGGRRGKLRKGSSDSGNEVEGPPRFQVRAKMADKLRALELHSKLVGDFEPDRVEVETGPSTLASIEERAKSVVSALSRAWKRVP